MTKLQPMCNGKVAMNAGKCDKAARLVQACNSLRWSIWHLRLYQREGFKKECTQVAR
ncbi:hypothetical protein PbB2_02689 [Candidatus Phycosocius bacilliformis]|uniref:Uncharacterized protein n=1 Tax=Candidatus Phycosocius bacilliformis TaxID=1445552 RepID=A0A2P2ED62_9PROT|nr:hypothetical protein PbB2_02689 [Candidatus Phycosocius bacilliformis]